MLNFRQLMDLDSTKAQFSYSLDPLETTLFLCGEVRVPYVYISSNNTATDIVPKLYTLPATV
ncbi:hypothetical protein AKO1_002277, partial [Acrasis kona]